MHIRLTLPLLIALLMGLGCTEQQVPKFALPDPVSVPAGQPAAGPQLSRNYDGGINLSWMERLENGASLHFANYRENAWQDAQLVVNDPKMFVNWADMPSVQTTGPDSTLAYWLSHTSEGTYSYQILSAQSANGGESWSAPVAPHKDGTHTEHGFVSTYSLKAGTGLIWLDGRETPDAGMTLRSATLNSNGDVSDEAILDDLVCDCCQTAAAMTSKGPVVVYRNRTQAEIRDIYVVRNIDGQWQPGVAVANDGWEISGCPVNGPAIDAIDNQVAVAWFTAANETPLVKVAVSANAGKSFSEPLIVSDNAPLGRVGISIINRTTYAISWLEPDDDGTFAVQIRGITMDGQMGRVRTVGRTGFMRAVPQMVRIGDRLILAWIDEFNDSHKVVSVKVPILGFYD